MDMANRVLAHIAEKYEKVQEGVKSVMGGKILEYEAKTIRNEGIEKGRLENILKSVRALMAKKGWTSSEAMDALDVTPSDRATLAAQL